MRIHTLAMLTLLAAPAFALAQEAPDAARVDAAVQAAFRSASAEWKTRLSQDETMRQCSAAQNNPQPATATEVQKREAATIKYPADGKFGGDWKKGEALAQSGYGLRFSDYPATRVNGGNCYACHQLRQSELSYGTLGPSLMQYGKLRDYSADAMKAAYEKIYNPHAALPCSNMPRFGANGVLTMEQIQDLVALLMSPDSPVNKEQ